MEDVFTDVTRCVMQLVLSVALLDDSQHVLWSVADASQVCGAVREMRWTPDGTALAMCWEHGGFSIWSVFGSLLHHSMAVEAGCVIF